MKCSNPKTEIELHDNLRTLPSERPIRGDLRCSCERNLWFLITFVCSTEGRHKELPYSPGPVRVHFLSGGGEGGTWGSGSKDTTFRLAAISCGLNIVLKKGNLFSIFRLIHFKGYIRDRVREAITTNYFSDESLFGFRYWLRPSVKMRGS